MYDKRAHEGGVIAFAPGTVWLDPDTGEFSKHEYRPTSSHDGVCLAACSCGWSEPGARHGDRAVAERLTREAWSAHVNGK